jgi:SHS2 domain-containing protein
MPYRTLEHTGDLAIEVMGASLDELFAESLFALTDCMTRVEKVTPRDSREVALAAPALDQLLVVFLNEGIWLHETEALVFSAADLSVAEVDQGWSLTGTLRGEAFDLHRQDAHQGGDLSPVERRVGLRGLGRTARLRYLNRASPGALRAARMGLQGGAWVISLVTDGPSDIQESVQ